MDHLSPEEIARLARDASVNGTDAHAHLDACSTCRKAYLLERALRVAIGTGTFVQLSPRFERRVMTVISRTTGTDRAFGILRLLGLAFPMMLVLVVVVLALTLSAAGVPPGPAEASYEPLRVLLASLQSALSAAGRYAEVVRNGLAERVPSSVMGLTTTILLSVLALVLADRLLARRLR